MAFTYFFRDMQTLELITRDVLPVIKGHRHIHIWDAGCAHGPEPYSIAIVLRGKIPGMLFRNVHIFATDIDTCDQFGKIIADGVYPEGEIKRIPADIRQKYFIKADQPDHHKLVDEIRSRVSFEKHDLLSIEPIRTGFSLIVCKNVLLHFGRQQRVNVIQMFHSALREGGFLVTEQTQKLPDEAKELFNQISPEAQVFKKLENCACKALAE